MEKLRHTYQKPTDIIETYIPNEETYAIIPMKHTDYHSIVMEKEAVYCVRQTPFEIINNACLEDFATFDGRRKLIASKYNYNHKTPMVISNKKGICAFPTMGLSNFECSWIFYKWYTWARHYKNQAFLEYPPNKRLYLDVSYHVLKKQMERVRELECDVIDEDARFERYKAENLPG